MPSPLWRLDWPFIDAAPPANVGCECAASSLSLSSCCKKSATVPVGGPGAPGPERFPVRGKGISHPLWRFPVRGNGMRACRLPTRGKGISFCRLCSSIGEAA